MRKARESRIKFEGLGGSTVARISGSLGTIFLDTGRLDSAEIYLRHSVEVYHQLGTGGMLPTLALANLGICLARRGRAAESDSLLGQVRDALPGAEEAGPLKTETVARLVRLHEERGDRAEAGYYRSLLARSRAVSPP